MASLTKAGSSDKICLLRPVVGDLFAPENWQYEPKAKNYFARIAPNPKYLFNRTFLHGKTLDEGVVFSKNDFPEGEIIEQKCVFIKGSKSETTFHGFFIINHCEDGIYGQQISQKECLEFFQLRQELPDPEKASTPKRELRVKCGTLLRKLAERYGHALVGEVMTELLEEFLPAPTINGEE
jgi:hypothetical protein